MLSYSVAANLESIRVLITGPNTGVGVEKKAFFVFLADVVVEISG
jgi:hypothetical protein